jgi:hypothetical protein
MDSNGPRTLLPRKHSGLLECGGLTPLFSLQRFIGTKLPIGG